MLTWSHTVATGPLTNGRQRAEAEQKLRLLVRPMGGPRVEPVQLLSPDGRVRDDPAWPLEVTPGLCRDFYRQMRRARRFDTEAVALQRQGELGLWLQMLGQEAAQVGSITALRHDDHVFPSYREHAAA